jgi:ammonia channel protein AmtB
MTNWSGLQSKIKSQWANFNLSEWSSGFLLEKNRLAMLIISFIAVGFCAYLWYSYIYNPSWSESRKQEYIESRKEESVVFDKNNFNKVISETENRKNNFQKSTENIPDIFSLE